MTKQELYNIWLSGDEQEIENMCEYITEYGFEDNGYHYHFGVATKYNIHILFDNNNLIEKELKNEN